MQSGISYHRRARDPPSSVLRPPTSVLRSPSSVLRSPFSVLRPPSIRPHSVLFHQIQLALRNPASPDRILRAPAGVSALTVPVAAMVNPPVPSVPPVDALWSPVFGDRLHRRLTRNRENVSNDIPPRPCPASTPPRPLCHYSRLGGNILCRSRQGSYRQSGYIIETLEHARGGVRRAQEVRRGRRDPASQRLSRRARDQGPQQTRRDDPARLRAKADTGVTRLQGCLALG